jgi:hypothetical protein
MVTLCCHQRKPTRTKASYSKPISVMSGPRLPTLQSAWKRYARGESRTVGLASGESDAAYDMRTLTSWPLLNLPQVAEETRFEGPAALFGAP